MNATRWFLPLIWMCFCLSQGHAESTNNLSAQAWVDRVEHAKTYETHWSLLEYDRTLLREYLERFQPKNDHDLRRMLAGIVVAGTDADFGKIDVISAKIKDPGEENDFKLLKNAILARTGDAEALRELFKPPYNATHVFCIATLADKNARDILAEISRSKDCSIMVRLDAIEALCHLGDNRSIDLLLSDQLFKAIEESHLCTNLHVLWNGIFNVALPAEVTTVQQARDWVIATNYKIIPQPIIAVEGGIDWSKVKLSDKSEPIR